MAKTLLNGVNEVLKKTGTLDSDAGLLTDLTDSARQTYIDLAVQVLNEVVDELYSLTRRPKPKQMREATITLADGAQSYGLKSDLVMLRSEYALIDETNNHIINVIPDGYREIIHGDLDQNDTGLPSFCGISPINGRLFMDRTPTSVEAGRVYRYRYDRDLELVLATDDFPFSNQVFRAIVPATAELWKFYRHLEFSQAIFDRSMARAARYLRQLPPRESYGKHSPRQNITDPLNGPTVA